MRINPWILMGTVVIVAAAYVFVAPACSCTTKETSYRNTMKADLRSLMSAQEVYFADSMTYAWVLPDSRYRPSVGVNIRITAAMVTGWSATAEHGLTDAMCGVFIGDVARPGTTVEDAEVSCWP